MGSIDGRTFLLVGDMRMRTMHSILYALSQFDAKAYVVGPPEMSLLPEFTLELDDRNVNYEVAESVEDCISECDVVYMEPVVQPDYTKSRDEEGGGEFAQTPDAYRVTRQLLREKAPHRADRPAQPAADGRASGRRGRDAPRALLAGGVQRGRHAHGPAGPRAGSNGVGHGAHAQREASRRGATRGTEPARAAPRRPRPALGQGRVRPGGLLWGVHGARGREGGRVLRPERHPRRGERRRDTGGPGRRRSGSLGEELRRGRRIPVRLLLAGDRDEGRGASGEEPRAVARRDRPCAPRQPVPLHGLREGRRCDRAQRARSPR